jgi:uncharacterized membrane protein YesL
MGFDGIRSHDYIYNLPDDEKEFIVKEYEKEYKSRVFWCNILGITFFVFGITILPFSIVWGTNLEFTIICLMLIVAGALLIILKDYSVFWIFYGVP